jgi:hypothetical protein
MISGQQIQQKFDFEFNKLQKLVASNPTKGIVVSMVLGAVALKIVQWIL